MTAKTDTLSAHPLDELRKPFPPHQISKLPKPTKAQTEAVQADFKKGTRCTVCGSWHHPDAVHLDYVGHAALTDRLLDVDPQWTWEPMGTTPEGLPAINGGLWIKLTVGGVSRYGFGAADGKTGGDAIKEMIGDALRNAAMRFGAALDLWHKGDLHVDDEPEAPRNGNGHQAQMATDADAPFPQGPAKNKTELKAKGRELWKEVLACEDRSTLDALTISHGALIVQLQNGLPQWWHGGTRDGETYEGLGQVIERMERDFDALEGTDPAWKTNPVMAG